MRWVDSSPSLSLPTWTEGELPADLVLIAKEAFEAVLEHLRSSDTEQGGLLLGQVWAKPNKVPQELAQVFAHKAVPAQAQSSTGLSLAMDASVWQAAQEIMKDSPLMVVGWYHSHPGLGAFFSATDCQTQAAFFNHPYSLGWVLDPSLAPDLPGFQALYLGAQASLQKPPKLA